MILAAQQSQVEDGFSIQGGAGRRRPPPPFKEVLWVSVSAGPVCTVDGSVSDGGGERGVA